MKAWMILLFFPALAFGQGYADLVERVQNAVVHIETTQEVGESQNRFQQFFDFFQDQRGMSPQPMPRGGSGAGFIISEDGYIVTNRHVIQDADSVRVILLDDARYDAEVIGIDDSLDIALIKIEADNLPAFSLGDSSKIRIGDEVLAMGYPLQLGFTVTRGIVSGIGRDLRTSGMDLGTYIQTDADITFGNSGGPLVTASGEVIGINTMIVTRGETYGFAIPSNLFKPSVDQLRTYGKVRRGALGITVSDMSPEALEYYGLAHGARVAQVYDQFPADKAGIERDDIILEINDRKIESGDDVVRTVAGLPPGAEVRMRYFSGGKERKAKVILADRTDFANGTRPDAEQPEEPDTEILENTGLGFSLIPLEDSPMANAGYGDEDAGFVVHRVDAGSLAGERGIQSGMILTHVNDMELKSVGDLNRALVSVDKGRPVRLALVSINISREGYERTPMTVFVRKN